MLRLLLTLSPSLHPLLHSTHNTAKENAALQACRQDNVTIASVEFLHDGKPSAGKSKGGGGGGGDAAAAPGATAAEATSAMMKRARVTSRGRGKKQKGSLHVRRDTVLARVVLSDGREFPVFGCVTQEGRRGGRMQADDVDEPLALTRLSNINIICAEA